MIMVMISKKKDNVVCSFGALPPHTCCICKKKTKKPSIWYTRWFIFVTPKGKKKNEDQKEMLLALLAV